MEYATLGNTGLTGTSRPLLLEPMTFRGRQWVLQGHRRPLARPEADVDFLVKDVRLTAASTFLIRRTLTRRVRAKKILGQSLKKPEHRAEGLVIAKVYRSASAGSGMARQGFSRSHYGRRRGGESPTSASGNHIDQ